MRVGAGAETVILSLSQSNQFIVIRSIPTASYNDQAGVVDTRHGFIFHSPHHTGLLYHALLLHLPLRRLTLHFELCLTDVSPPVAAEGAQPVATIAPSVLNVQQGQRAEFRCTVTGNPTPAIEWIGMTGVSVSCCIISSAEQSCVKFTSWYTKIPPYRRSREQNESQSRDTRRRTDLHGSGPSWWGRLHLQSPEHSWGAHSAGFPLCPKYV